jgi:membrane protease YdiL (CAAX protease family)
MLDTAEHTNALPSKTDRAGIAIGSFLIGLIVILGAAYSQYIVSFGLIVDFLVVYGIPVAVVSLIWGRTILRKALNRSKIAFEYGLGYFAIFTVLGTIAGIIILSILLVVDPSTLNLLHRPNPVLNVPAEFAWIMVVVSFLIVGPAEEYLFRGFVYGGLLSIFHRHHWFVLAFVSALFFAAAHLYYAYVYGAASLILFADLVAFGMAMAATYYISGGNLLAPAIIHGAYDATGFIGVATTPLVLYLLRGSLILIGLFFAAYIFLRRFEE